MCWQKNPKHRLRCQRYHAVFHQSLAHTDAGKWQMALLSILAGLLAQFGGRGKDLCCQYKQKPKSASHKTKQRPSATQTNVHLFGH